MRAPYLPSLLIYSCVMRKGRHTVKRIRAYILARSVVSHSRSLHQHSASSESVAEGAYIGLLSYSHLSTFSLRERGYLRIYEKSVLEGFYPDFLISSLILWGTYKILIS